jgi:hypothetical protein
MGEFVGLYRGGYCVPAASSNQRRNRGSRRGKRKQGAQRPAAGFRPPIVGRDRARLDRAATCFACKACGRFRGAGLETLVTRREQLPRNQPAMAEARRGRHPTTKPSDYSLFNETAAGGVRVRTAPAEEGIAERFAEKPQLRSA